MTASHNILLADGATIHTEYTEAGSLEDVLLPLLGDVEDDLGDLLGLGLREADLLAELVVPLDDLPLLLVVPVLLRTLLLGFSQLICDLHAGGYEVDDLLVDYFDLLSEFVSVRHWSHQIVRILHGLKYVCLRGGGMEDSERISVSMNKYVYQCSKICRTMEFLGDYFKGYPSQQKVAGKLLSCGIRVARRVVRSTLERISSTPELAAIFSKARPTLSMVDMAPEIGCSSIVITPTDATLPGILADITEVLFRFNVSVRQAMVDDSGNGAVLQVVAYGRIPPEAIPELRSCRGVSSVLIK